MRLSRPLLALAALAPLAADAAAQGTPPWQIRADYDMDVRMETARHRYAGTQRLTLRNASPDTLRTVYYHLYFNAFQTGSQMAERNRHLPDPDRRVVPKIHSYTPDTEGFLRATRLTQNGTVLQTETYDTILKATLARPIPPGGTAVLAMDFNGQVPLQTRRSGRDSGEGVDYSMVQWYPKLAMYDSRGWHPAPYIGREFYAPFGTYNVAITLPDAYTLGATGVLQNPQQVGKGYERRGSRVAPATNGQRTWRFRAENVHDFGWVADRDFVHETLTGPGGMPIHLLYQPDVAAGWASQRQLMPEIFRFFGERFGTYAWPQFTVAQGGDGGMEYNMMTLITGGRQPGSLRGVTIHETAHMWFYGMLASNEVRYAWMDEGFTEFATTALEQHLDGKPEDHRAATRGIVAAMKAGAYTQPPSTPSDHFDTNRSYSVGSYGAGEMLLEQLGLVMGDEVRDRALRRYFREYRFRHPQPADVERVMEAESGLELGWLFWQLMETTRTMDYAVESVTPGAAETTVQLKRIGPLFFPLDVRLTFADGSTRMATIPLGEMLGAKRMPGWFVAPAWSYTAPTYRFAVPGRVTKVEIDPDERTLDLDRSNNTR